MTPWHPIGFFYFFAGLAIFCAIMMVVAPQRRSQRHLSDHRAAGDRRNFSPIASGVSVHRADDPIRRRDHGAYCLRDHAGEPPRCRTPASVQPAIVARRAAGRRLGAQVLLMARIDAAIFNSTGLPHAHAAKYRARWPSRFSRRYMLPFEIASIMLLVAMIGAVLMAKRRI